MTTDDAPITLDEACSDIFHGSTVLNAETIARERKRVLKRASNLKWQRANRDKIAASQRRWRAKESTKEKEARCRRRWLEANRERNERNIKRWRKSNPDKVALTAKKVNIKKKYGMTLEQRNAILAAQDFRCAICRSNSTGWKQDWIVDHCHESGKVRGILCAHCNRIVHQRATPDVLHAAAKYIKTFQASR